MGVITQPNIKEVDAIRPLTKDWNKFARDIFGVRLDDKQKEALYLIQHNRRVEIRSGHARGKDYVAAVASLCFLNLYIPSKVICTAPTQRQAVNINMAEISNIHRNSRVPLPGIVLTSMIKMPYHDNPRETNEQHFLLAFKAGDKSVESWTGFHAPNVLIIVTEASGVSDSIFTSLEGLMTGENPKQLLIYNPNTTQCHAYKASLSKNFAHLKLSCLDAPNVVNKNSGIPGQVDYVGVKEQVEAWCQQIQKSEMQDDKHDFEFDGQCWRPNDLARVKILGEFPLEGEDQVIPMAWVEAAFNRGDAVLPDYNPDLDKHHLDLGVDVAGMGADKTIATFKKDNIVFSIDQWQVSGSDSNVHMSTVGKIKNYLTNNKDCAYIDSIGEGAGVYSRAKEMKLNAVSVKGSKSAKGLKDHYGVKEFINYRCWLIWSIRDALDPKSGVDLVLPRDYELMEELTAVKVSGLTSSGKVQLISSQDLKKELKRSPDKLASLSMCFARNSRAKMGGFYVGGGLRE